MRLIPRASALVLACVFALSAPASANEAITTQPIAQGQLVVPADIAMWPETSRNETGGAITALLGVQNLLPAVNPLTISLSNSAMTFTVGGGGQAVIAQDSASGGSGNTRYIDSCPATTGTLLANSSGSTRTDLLSIEYVSGNPSFSQSQTNPHAISFSNGTFQTVSNALESCAFNYGTNTTTPPANYVAFARIAVPNGATTASQATITYLFPTVASQLASVMGGVVGSINGVQGAVTLAQGNGILVTTAGNTVTTTLSTPVSVANGGTGTGSPSFASGTNTTVSGSFPFQSVNVVGNPTFSGLVTANAGLTVAGTTTTSTLNTAAITSSSLIQSTNPSAAFAWTNSAGGLAQTALVADGSFKVPPSTGITDTVLGLINQGGTKVMAVDSAGNLGIAGGLNSPGVATFGNAVNITGTLSLTTTPLAVGSGGTGTTSPSLASGSNTSISGTWPAQSVNVSSSPTFSGTATAQYLVASGNGSSYAVGGFPNGSLVNNPRVIVADGTATISGTTNTFPNGFSFSGSGFIRCIAGAPGGAGQVGASATGSNGVILYTNNGSPTTVSYICFGN